MPSPSSPPPHAVGTSPTRRRLLATLGTSVGFAGLAGCLGSDDEVPDPEPLELSPTDWTHERGGPDHARTTTPDAAPDSLFDASLDEAWSVTFPTGDTVAPPVVRDGRLFVQVTTLDPSEDMTASRRQTVLVAIDAASGDELWRFDPERALDEVTGTPTLPGGEVRERLTVSGAAALGDTVFVTSFAGDRFHVSRSTGGRLTALDAATGDVRWDRATWPAPEPTVDPAGRVYLTEWSDSVVRSGTDREFVRRVRSQRLRLRAFDAATGEVLWSYPTQDPVERLLDPPGYPAQELRIYPPSLGDDALLWPLSPAYDDDSFEPRVGPELHRLDPETGEALAVQSIDTTVSRPLSLGTDGWYSGVEDWHGEWSQAERGTGLVGVSSDGTRLFRDTVSQWSGGFLCVAADAGVVCTTGNVTRAVDGETGERLWVNGDTDSAPVAVGQRIAYVRHPGDETARERSPAERELVVRDARSGAVETTHDLQRGAQSSVPAAERLFVTTHQWGAEDVRAGVRAYE